MRTSMTVVTAAVLSLAVAGAAYAGADAPTFDAKGAAAYMDGRQAWWQTWQNSQRDHDTFCISCHSAMPYAIARPQLRGTLGETAPSEPERKLIENVVKRVTMWRDVEPWYPDQTRGIPKTSESRGTESVFDAFVLALRDSQKGRLSDDTRAAFDHMWALQLKALDGAGSWAWINFHYEPWEAPQSPYFGASMAAIAVATAPEGYAKTPAIQDNLKLLRGYFEKETDKQSLFNRMMGLWASTRIEGLLTKAQQQKAIDDALQKQQADGGWATSSLASWTRVDNTPEDTASDGFATGLVTLALQSAGVPASDPRVAKGLVWLRAHQNHETGQWYASSQNKNRDPNSDIGKFMSDAATAYAVLALTQR